QRAVGRQGEHHMSAPVMVLESGGADDVAVGRRDPGMTQAHAERFLKRKGGCAGLGGPMRPVRTVVTVAVADEDAGARAVAAEAEIDSVGLCRRGNGAQRSQAQKSGKGCDSDLAEPGDTPGWLVIRCSPDYDSAHLNRERTDRSPEVHEAYPFSSARRSAPGSKQRVRREMRPSSSMSRKTPAGSCTLWPFAAGQPLMVA